MKKSHSLLFSTSLALVAFSAVFVSSNGTSTAADLTTINHDFLPTSDEIYEWHVLKDEGGPTFTGSPSWLSFTKFLEASFQERGLMDVTTDTFSYTRWYTSDDPKAGQWSLTIEGEEIDVASYWAYSGSTGSRGLTAPLIYYDLETPPDSIEGKIVVFDVPSLRDSRVISFQDSGYEFATDEDNLRANAHLVSDQFYQSNYVTRFGKLDHIMANGKAAGGLVIFDMSSGRAAGLYTFPLLSPSKVGVPGLYLDRVAGARVREAALEGREATLKLLAVEEEAHAYFFAGYLPGKNYGKESDEIILLVTHTDGPSISQDNGALGILGVIEYFSSIPQVERPRTLLVLLDPQHVMPGRHNTDWYALHPDAAGKIVASFGIEHLGRKEYIEQGNDFGPSGLPALTIIFVHDNDVLIDGAVKAVKDQKLPRTFVRSPPRGGQGNWSGLSDVALERQIPGYGISSTMTAYYSTRARIKSFDKDLCFKQIAAVAQLTGVLMSADLQEIAVPR